MKFPLPADTFPTLALSQDEERKLAAAAETVVQRGIAQYHEHLTVHTGVVDDTRWKKIKHRDNVCVYRERSASIDDSVSASNSSSSSTTTGDDAKPMTSTLVTGSMPGNLDDVMYGMLNTTTEEMQLKSAFLEDGFVDWKVLASIATPTKQEPYRELSLKWTVKGHPLVMGAFMNIRDALYIESTGIAKTPSGERLGYHIMHSVVLSGIRELTELQILRLDLTACEFFRQKDDKSVEVYGRGLIGPSGDIPRSFLAISIAEVALSVFKLVHGAEMKKLMRIVGSRARGQSTTTSVLSDHQPPETTTCALCEKCLKSLLPFARSSEKQCCICGERVCSRCRVLKTIYALSEPVEKRLTTTNMAFCTRCIHSVASASSHAFAVIDALAAQDKETANYCEALLLPL